MNTYAFKVIDAISREGLDNGSWSLVQDIDDTVAYFGTADSIELKGQWAYVYIKSDDYLCFLSEIEPTHRMHIEGDDWLMLYKLD